MLASPAPAGVLGPTKASQLASSPFFNSATSGVDCDLSPNQVFAPVSPQPGSNQVFVVTGYSWHVTGAPANSFVSVNLYANQPGGGGGSHVSTSGTIANSAGQAIGSALLQPGVIGLRPNAGLTKLCLKIWEGSGTIASGTGTVTGYIATDK
jgi:hypothetical protein